MFEFEISAQQKDFVWQQWLNVLFRLHRHANKKKRGFAMMTHDAKVNILYNNNNKKKRETCFVQIIF